MSLKRTDGKKCLQIFCMMLFFISTMAFALGLGDIKLKSGLNEPLKADIEVLKMGNLTFSQLKVGLASREEFAHLGVDRHAYLSNLRFKLTYDAQKKPIIAVTSNDPLTDPILNFIISVDMGNGKLLRQYTLFLDPPHYLNSNQNMSSSGPVNVAKPKINQPLVAPNSEHHTAPHPVNIPVVAVQVNTPDLPPKKIVTGQQEVDMEQAQAQAQAQAPVPVSLTQYGPTKPQDTLWSIVNLVKPSMQVTMQQTMLAIFRKNPQAFVYNNMNGLKNKAMLALPTINEIKQTSPHQALLEVEKQKRDWRAMLDKENQLSTTTNNPSVNNLTKSMVETPTIGVVPAKTTVKVVPAPAPISMNTTQPADTTVTTGGSPTSENLSKTTALPILLPPTAPIVTNTTPASNNQAPVNPVVINSAPMNVPTNSTLEKPPIINMPVGTTPVNGTTVLQTGGDDTLVKTLQSELTTINQSLNESRQSNQFLKQKMDEMTQQNKQILDLMTQKDKRINELEEGLSEIGQLQNVQHKTEKGPSLKNNSQISAQVKMLKVGSQGGAIPQKAKESSLLGPFLMIIVLLLSIAAIYGYWRKRRIAEKEQLLMQGYDTLHATSPDVLMDERTVKVSEPVLPDPVATTHDMEIQEEISVYMAYGRYQKAIQVLEATLASKGDIPELIVMLLECYVNLNDRASFDNWITCLPHDFENKYPDLSEKVKGFQKQLSLLQEQEPHPQTPVSTELAHEESTYPIPEHENFSDHVQESVSPDNQPDEEEMSHQISFEHTESIPMEIESDPDEEFTHDFSSEEFTHDIPFEHTDDDLMTIENDINRDVEHENGDDFKIEPIVDDEDLMDDHSFDDDKGEATKLDLARVYIEMGELAEAKTLIEEVLASSDAEHHHEAEQLLQKLSNPQ